MDNLVDHIHDVHIGQRQKKYSCEWEKCARKGMPHASGYALRAHMRSHTREKPFYCQLPECDRSFTRSDALAKHMRTVHETEALRPSDPVPKNHSSSIANGGNGTGANGNLKRIKLIVSNGDKSRQILGELPPLPTNEVITESGEPEPLDMDSVRFELPVNRDYYPSEMYDRLDDHERSLPPSQYYRLLRRQIKWAEQDDRRLRSELEQAEQDRETQVATLMGESTSDRSRRVGWMKTEALLDDVLGRELEQVVEAFQGEVDASDPWAAVNGLKYLVVDLGEVGRI